MKNPLDSIKKRYFTPKKPIIEDDVTHRYAGPLRENKFDINASFYDIDPEVLAQHTPIQKMSPINPNTHKLLTAANIKSMRKRNLIPHTFANPVQHVDNRLYESLMKHTFIGSLVDSFVKYLVGIGFKPELELLNPDVDEEKNKKQIESGQQIISDLLEIDRQIDLNESEDIDVSFQDKVTAMITSTLAYNRGALMYIYEKPIEIRGVQYDTIPNHMIFAHAQDLGMIETDPDTWRLKKVQWRMDAFGLTDVKDMIYLWNPITSSKVHNSWYYGISIITPMIPASKLLRQLLSNDFPAMAKNAWANPLIFVTKSEGNTKESKKQEWQDFSNGLKSGSANVVIADPADTDVHTISFDPKIGEFQALFESMIKLCISIIGLPQVGFYDESATNRDTMLGKIQLTMRTTIDPMREWIGKSICQQHYQRWFELLYKGKPELDLFKIKLSWSDLHIADWRDQIEAALLADSRLPFKNHEFGEIIGLDNYENMVDPDGELVPGGSGGGKASMTDPETGDKVDMKMSKGKK